LKVSRLIEAINRTLSFEIGRNYVGQVLSSMKTVEGQTVD